MPNENINPVLIDSAAIAARVAEANQTIPEAQFSGGCNAGASNANGIGIGTQTNLDESLPSWTLLDQKGQARAPQNSQIIGGDETAIELVTTSTDGTVTVNGEATLSDLETGWE